jgi:hypothetical protein
MIPGTSLFPQRLSGVVMRRGIISTMKFRKLRITWLVGWGLLTVLLIALWVRSYWWKDNLYFSTPGTDTVNYSDVKTIRFFSTHGRIGITNRQINWPAHIRLEHSKFLLPHREYSDEHGQTSTSMWFRIMRWSTFTEILMPDWFLVIGLCAVAIAPWIHWSKRFSLRTLLIATTLVAVVLGLIVYGIRK